MMRAAVGIVALVVGSGCATDYVHRMAPVRKAYEAGRHDEALALLEKDFAAEKKEDSINRLLFLLDKGMVLHAAGRWADSIAVFNEADELSKQLDFTSVSEEAGVLLSNEGTRVYRGEDFEKLMISLVQAINYFEQEKAEDALVEVRRINERIQKMIVDEKKPYEQLAIARYLGGVIWEDQQELDSAAIDYLEAAKLMKKNVGALRGDLLRVLKATGRDDAYAEFGGPQAKEPAQEAKRTVGAGQLVVVVEAGVAPEKVSTQQEYKSGVPRPTLVAIPFYPPRNRPVPKAHLTVGGDSVEATTVTSIDQVAKVHLNDRVGKLVAKQLASMALKAGLAAGIGAATKSEALGALAFGALMLTQQADTRSWLSLPAEFQVARLSLPAGDHVARVAYGGKTIERTVRLRRGRVTLLVVRGF